MWVELRVRALSVHVRAPARRGDAAGGRIVPVPETQRRAYIRPMKRLILCLVLAVPLLPAPAPAQVQMSIQIGLPVAPPLVVIQPGIQVVQNFGEEVFFVDDWYWCRRGDAWYRARRPHAAFAYVEPRFVPYRLAYLPPPGHYRHWNKARLKEERRWWKEHDKERRRTWREHDKAQRQALKDERGRGRGHAYGHEPARGGPAYTPAERRVTPTPAPAISPAPAKHDRGGHGAVPAPPQGGDDQERRGHQGPRH
jgi:hypothetical protein